MTVFVKHVNQNPVRIHLSKRHNRILRRQTEVFYATHRAVNIHGAQPESSFLCFCRKIVDHVDYLTSPEQVADYVKKFR